MDVKKVKYWNKLKGLIQVLSEKEIALRKEVVAENFDTYAEGTNTLVENDIVLKYVCSFNRKVTGDIPALLKTNPEMGRFFKQKWELDLTEYRKAKVSEFNLIETQLETKLGSPQLKVSIGKQP